jgi:predicted ATPase
MWELRAANGLARLWRQAGRLEEARAVLAPVLGGFTEGFDTPDLIEGQAILDELASPGVPNCRGGRPTP